MVQFISHYTEKYSYLDSIRMALQGGCRWIQLRMKDASAHQVLQVARVAQRLCKEHGATFIIDDYVEIVRELQADGVHLGKNDMPIDEARRFLGNDYIIGGTANNYSDAMKNIDSGADYIGYGPFRFTETKKKLAPVLGLNGYQDIMDRFRKEDIRIPLVAIGGITIDDLPDIMQTGVDGVALSGEILRADDPIDKMRKVIETVICIKDKEKSPCVSA